MKQKINIKKIFDLSKFTDFQKLGLLVVLLCVLVMCTKLFEKLRDNSGTINISNFIDYNNVNADYLVSISTEEKDRKIYWTLDAIIKEFIKSYQSIEKFESYDGKIKYEGPSVSDFYNCLDSKYKVTLSKNKYIELSTSFMKKFVKQVQYYDTLSIDNVINSIYEIQDNMYICKLNTSIDGTNAHIGITLNQSKNTYSIFYIE